jgi:hypothetical protein
MVGSCFETRDGGGREQKQLVLIEQCIHAVAEL